MTYRYSASTQGWYPDHREYADLPDDLIEVPDELYKYWASTPGSVVVVRNGAVIVQPYDYQRPEGKPAPPRAAPPPSPTPPPPSPVPSPSPEQGDDGGEPKPVNEHKPPAKTKKPKAGKAP